MYMYSSFSLIKGKNKIKKSVLKVNQRSAGEQVCEGNACAEQGTQTSFHTHEIWLRIYIYIYILFH